MRRSVGPFVVVLAAGCPAVRKARVTPGEAGGGVIKRTCRAGGVTGLAGRVGRLAVGSPPPRLAARCLTTARTSSGVRCTGGGSDGGSGGGGVQQHSASIASNFWLHSMSSAISSLSDMFAVHRSTWYCRGFASSFATSVRFAARLGVFALFCVLPEFFQLAYVHVLSILALFVAQVHDHEE